MKKLSPNVLCFKRTEILKYPLTCNPKKHKDKELKKYIYAISETYPFASYVETIFKDFYEIIMRNSPEKIDDFIGQHDSY